MKNWKCTKEKVIFQKKLAVQRKINTRWISYISMPAGLKLTHHISLLTTFCPVLELLEGFLQIYLPPHRIDKKKILHDESKFSQHVVNKSKMRQNLPKKQKIHHKFKTKMVQRHLSWHRGFKKKKKKPLENICTVNVLLFLPGWPWCLLRPKILNLAWGTFVILYTDAEENSTTQA